jgi:hypothetical protein
MWLLKKEAVTLWTENARPLDQVFGDGLLGENEMSSPHRAA